MRLQKVHKEENIRDTSLFEIQVNPPPTDYNHWPHMLITPASHNCHLYTFHMWLAVGVVSMWRIYLIIS